MYAYMLTSDKLGDRVFSAESNPVTRPDLWPEFDRLRPLELRTWKDDKGIIVACKHLIEHPLTLGAFGDQTNTDDGLVFLPPSRDVKISEFRNPDVRNTITVELTKGDSIDIVPADMAPKDILFSPTGATLGGFSDDYAPRCLEYYEHQLIVDIESSKKNPDKEKVKKAQTRIDEMIGPLFLDALTRAYYITPELLMHCRWVASDDLVPVMQATWGMDPKKKLGEGVGLEP